MNKSKQYWKLCLFFTLIWIILFQIENILALPLEGIQVYRKDAHLYSEHKQKIADDIIRYRNADNIWDVLREEFNLSHYEDNPIVQDRIDWYMSNQDFVLRAASRAAPYLYYILQQVKKRHLPAEIVLVPIVESGYNPFAISSMGASGLWQIMPETATGFGIRQDSWYDGRRDVIASTRAALTYLSYLQSFFEGNWLLAFAAYNTGEGNVLAAIKRNIREGKNTEFWSLPVAQQTRSYVPSLLALAAIISNPTRYPIYFPPVRNAPYLAQVDIGKQINLKYAASYAGISFKKMLQLNPGFNQSTTSKKGPYKLVLPIENVEQFSENFSRSPTNQAVKWFHYKVKNGDSLISLAKRFNATIIALRQLNHIQGSQIHPGTNLLIPNTVDTSNDKEMVLTPTLFANNNSKVNFSSHQTNQARKTKINASNLFLRARLKEKKYQLQPGDTIYIVREDDSLEKIAKKFQVSSAVLLSLNQTTKQKILPGKKMIIPKKSLRKELFSKVPGLLPGDTLYMVRKGDTLEKIAHKFRISAASLRLANLITNNSLLEGEKIIVPSQRQG